jgi:alpha-galactosidase/6-phospho-beta-glucosidase family protein
MISLDKTLNALQIQELTKKYSNLQSQYIDLIGQKETTDDTYRQLLVSMKLTEKAISETISSINKRSVKMVFLQKKLLESKEVLDDLIPDLIQAEDDLVSYTQ